MSGSGGGRGVNAPVLESTEYGYRVRKRESKSVRSVKGYTEEPVGGRLSVCQ